ncbi:Uma2 family endonuclease [soil metagenome]
MTGTGTIPMPPRTMLEVFNGLPEGTMAQLIENNIVISPALLDRHQVITGEIYSEILRHVKNKKLGQVRIAPYDVYLERKNVYQPDICFISAENQHLIKENGLHGAPDLVIEILSPGTARYDMYDKKDVYERTGVKELWLIDPADKRATGYWLTNGEYQEFFKGNGVIELKLINIKIEF